MNAKQPDLRPAAARPDGWSDHGGELRDTRAPAAFKRSPALARFVFVPVASASQGGPSVPVGCVANERHEGGEAPSVARS